MLVLYETAAGYALFKLLDESKIADAKDLFEDFETPEKASKFLKLKHFFKFEDTTEALAATCSAVEGKLGSKLKKFIKKTVLKEAHKKLAVADAKLGNAIKSKFEDIECVSSSGVQELMRGIRYQVNNLITGLLESDTKAMSLGLAHSLSRYKLKFSPDKVDTMIVQAISLLDDLDKELNNYVMRLREWYGWHFPEIGKIVTDHTAYAKLVKLMGDRCNALEMDLSSVLPEDLEQDVKNACKISMGTDISEEDIAHIRHMCDEVLSMSGYRVELYDYLKNRMIAVAPNLTVLVGELVGARLIAHAGSLLNLAKHPSSTVQILGAEKALFRALKTKHDTPKYGLIYHASLVGQSNQKNKGKISRTLAAKTALAVRYDALGEGNDVEMGIKHKESVERRIRDLESGFSHQVSGTGKQKTKFAKYESHSEVKTYDENLDSTISKKRKFEEESDEPETMPEKKARVDVEAPNSMETPVKKKKKKSHVAEETPVDETPAKKKKSHAAQDTPVEEISAKKKKSKKEKKKKVESD